MIKGLFVKIQFSIIFFKSSDLEEHPYFLYALSNNFILSSPTEKDI